MHGYDVAAWALYRGGDPRAAAPLARAALARRVGDVALEHRAAIIAAANANTGAGMPR